MKRPIRIDLENETTKTLLQQEHFRVRLGRAARLTNRTGHEVRFDYVCNPNHDYGHATPVFEGGASSVDREDFIRWRERYFENIDLHSFISFHTHPDEDGLLAISKSDIENIATASLDYQVNAIVMVGEVRRNLSGSLLLMQRTCDAWWYEPSGLSIISEAYERVLERAACRDPPSELARAIEVPGFLHAAILEYVIPRRSNIATLVNPDILDSFDLSRAIRPGPEKIFSGESANFSCERLTVHEY